MDTEIEWDISAPDLAEPVNYLGGGMNINHKEKAGVLLHTSKEICL